MRVIAGIYRGRTLRSVAGLAVRPTSDRLRETLFNVLAGRIDGASFLDMCAGSGAVGIEALSRGAQQVTFVERSRRACETIQSNLNALEIGSEATVVNREAASAIKQLARLSKQFDLVFVDPPYASEVHDQVMTRLDSTGILSPGAIVVIEHRVKTPPAAQYGALRMYREVRQGESALSFYEVRSSKFEVRSADP